MVRLRMKAIQERLPEDRFLRIHRSFIISLLRIDSIRGKSVFIQDKELPIGQSYVADFQRHIQEA